MEIQNIHEAKTNFSRLVERVRRGEEIVIGKADEPVAKLVPFDAGTSPRRGGQWRGLVGIADDFDVLPPELCAAFSVDGD